jgi:hypothetical protein
VSVITPRNDDGPSSLGLEEAQVAAVVQIAANIKSCLARQAQAWDPVDQNLSQVLGVHYRRTKLEEPPRGCIYPGVRGGVLAMPWDRFPALYVMADRATARPDMGSDGVDVYSVALYVEGIVRSDAFNYEDRRERVFHEGAVDRRAKRTINAVVECVELDPTLGGAVLPLPAPAAGQTDPFTLQGEEPKDKTLKRVFSAIRIDWTLDTYSVRLDAQTPVPGVLPRGLGEGW